MRVQAGPWLAIVSLLALPAASAQALLAGVVPDLPGAAEGDEAVMVGALEDVSLGGWSLSDGEGAWRLPPLQLRRGEVATFTGNVSRWAAFDGRADAQWPAGTLRLANDGDDVRLLRPDGSLADSFAWGDGRAPGMDGSVRYTSPALVYRRLPAAHGGQPWTDTDSADDWRTPRMHRVGESSHPPLRLQAEGAVLYASPDSSHAVLAQAIRSARERLHLHVYDLRSPSLVDLLVEQRAAHPLLDLQVLVEDRPVGQDTLERHETAWALRRIEAAGGTAWLAGSVRYAHHHLKVLVADDQVAVQSENWVPSGVPQDPTWGNRGWGVLLRGAAVADAVAAWLAADRAAHDTARFQLATYAPTYEEPVRRPPRAGTHQPVPPLAVARPLEVQLVLAPDHTADPRADPVAALVRDARREVLVQQLDVRTASSNHLGWKAYDVLTRELAAAAGRGVQVRVQAAAPFSAADDGNRGALAFLAGRGVEASEWRSASLPTLHNKGLVVDGEAAVVGSMNGNHHSRSANREMVVVLLDAQAAAYYRALFLADAGPAQGGTDGAPAGLPVPAAPWPMLFALALLVLATRR